jgi:uncharacterized membrane protein YedE/YeeE
MANIEFATRSSGGFHNWLITLAIIFLSVFGVILSLICIYSMPNHAVRPAIGAVFYICSAIVIVFLLFLRWRRDIAIEEGILLKAIRESEKFVIKDSISDKIVKWVVTIYAFFFVLDGLALALICIYALPDKTVQPKVGVLYLFAGSIVLASFVFVVWKNWMSEKR